MKGIENLCPAEIISISQSPRFGEKRGRGDETVGQSCVSAHLKKKSRSRSSSVRVSPSRS
jgi:hypothetical protein